MAQRGIREYEGKRIFHDNWGRFFGGYEYPFESASVADGAELRALAGEPGYEWLNAGPLVVKPDMLFGKRGLNGLVYYKEREPGDVGLDAAAAWMDARLGVRTTLLGGQGGVLSRFIVEPFVPHAPEAAHYLSATTGEDHDTLHIGARGGVDVEANWDAVHHIDIPLDADEAEIDRLIAAGLPEALKGDADLTGFVQAFYRFFRDLHFSDLELNPFLLRGRQVHLLDLVAKLDDSAHHLMQPYWGDPYFPTPFGMKAPGAEEKMIRELDEGSGASLKLTVLRPEARVWTLVAGGGASVVYADTIADLIGVEDLANYGEYSGNPSIEETYLYARTILDLMTRRRDPEGRPKVLLIGGAIANFTDVARTFTGIIQALEEYQDRLHDVGLKIYVRRGGPNYETGLRDIRTAARRMGLPIEVYGPETHMTDIVRMAVAA